MYPNLDMLNLIVMLINDNYVNLNYMVLIDVLNKKKQKFIYKKKVFLFSLKQLPEHECLCVVENVR